MAAFSCFSFRRDLWLQRPRTSSLQSIDVLLAAGLAEDSYDSAEALVGSAAGASYSCARALPDVDAPGWRFQYMICRNQPGDRLGIEVAPSALTKGLYVTNVVPDTFVDACAENHSFFALRIACSTSIGVLRFGLRNFLQVRTGRSTPMSLSGLDARCIAQQRAALSICAQVRSRAGAFR